MNWGILLSFCTNFDLCRKKFSGCLVSTIQNESPQANGGVTDGEARSGIDSGAQGDSPNRAVPRQRRRPQRRGVRHRSAPTEGEAAAEESQGDGGDPSGEPQSQPPPRELRNQGRPFRRPFRVRGGSFRYMNGYSNPPGKFGEHIDGAGHGQRQNQFSGRNGYDRNGGIPRRRMFLCFSRFRFVSPLQCTKSTPSEDIVS